MLFRSQKDDKTIEEITLDLNGLKGSDIIAAERQTRALGETSPTPLFTATGQAVVAAKASGLIYDDIADLSAGDFVQVTTEVGNFLFDWVLPSSQEKN